METPRGDEEDAYETMHSNIGAETWLELVYKAGKFSDAPKYPSLVVVKY